MSSRSITLAKNWKKKEIDNVLYLKEQMNQKKISQTLIDNYLNEQYDIINKKFEEKINKAQSKVTNNYSKRKNTIEFIIKTKTFMEKHNINPNLIKKYTNSHYDFVNEKYKKTKEISDFID